MNFENMIQIGTTPTPPKILLTGVEGVGKSTAGLSLPSPIYLCAENGLVGHQFKNVANYRPTDWDEIYEFIMWLIGTNTKYQSLVIDSLDWLEPILYKYISRKKNVETIEDIPFSKGYKSAAIELRRLLDFIDRLNLEKKFTILITAHTQIKTFSNPLGENYDRYEVKAYKDISAIVREWCDCVLFANYVTVVKAKQKKADVSLQKRIVYTNRTAGYDAKNRHNLPAEIVFDMSKILQLLNTKDSNQETAKTIESINSFLEQIAPEKKEVVKKHIEKNKNNLTELKKTLNRVLVLIEEGSTEPEVVSIPEPEPESVPKPEPEPIQKPEPIKPKPAIKKPEPPIMDEFEDMEL